MIMRYLSGHAQISMLASATDMKERKALSPSSQSQSVIKAEK